MLRVISQRKILYNITDMWNLKLQTENSQRTDWWLPVAVMGRGVKG